MYKPFKNMSVYQVGFLNFEWGVVNLHHTGKRHVLNNILNNEVNTFKVKHRFDAQTDCICVKFLDKLKGMLDSIKAPKN